MVFSPAYLVQEVNVNFSVKYNTVFWICCRIRKHRVITYLLLTPYIRCGRYAVCPALSLSQGERCQGSERFASNIKNMNLSLVD